MDERNLSGARGEGEPKVKWQLLRDVARAGRGDEFTTKQWTQAQLDNWENSGYRTQEGHYTEIGLFDSEKEMRREMARLATSENA